MTSSPNSSAEKRILGIAGNLTRTSGFMGSKQTTYAGTEHGAAFDQLTIKTKEEKYARTASRLSLPLFGLLLLSALTVAALAAGCGSPDATTTSTAATASSTTAEITTTPAPSPEEQARIDLLTDKALQFVQFLVDERFADAHATFDATMETALPVDELEAVWTQLESQMGGYMQNVAVRHESDSGYLAVIVQAEFEQAPLDIRLVYDRDDLVAGLFFQPARSSSESPPYASADTFTERELTVGGVPWELPATLTLPTGDGPFPAVVLVHGSGPNDRDETLGPNKPFRDLAEGLATAGVAVLRYEKRTLHYADELAAAADLTVQEETVEDALAAVEILRAIPEISAERIFMLGHSLGGMLIPRIGAADTDIAGFIVAAGAARPLEDLILEQTRYLLSLEKELTAEQQAALTQLEERVERVKDPGLSPGIPASDLPLGIPAAYWLDLRGYDPPAAARALGRPLLVIQGGRDYQVTQADFALWKEALDSAPGVELKIYPRLNHLFMAGEGSSRPAEYLHQSHVAEEVVQDIARFIQR